MGAVRSGVVDLRFAACFAVRARNKMLLKMRERSSAVGVVIATIIKPVPKSYGEILRWHIEGYRKENRLFRAKELAEV